MQGRYVARNTADTVKIAAQFADCLRGGETVLFFGELGSGKTTFTASLAAALGCSETVTSPTFVIMNRYRGRLTVNHFDMYRIDSFDSLYGTGYFDVAGEPDSVTLVEWGENVADFLPPPDYTVRVSYGEGEQERIYEISEAEKR